MTASPLKAERSCRMTMSTSYPSAVSMRIGRSKEFSRKSRHVGLAQAEQPRGNAVLEGLAEALAERAEGCGATDVRIHTLRRGESRCGFKTAIVERHFRPDFRVGADYSDDAVCGVDDALAFAALGDVGFGRIIEIGRSGFRSNSI